MDNDTQQDWRSSFLDSAGVERLIFLAGLVDKAPVLADVTALTYQEVAYMLRVNPRTVRRYVADGQLDAYNLAGKATPRVRLVDLQAFWQRSPRTTDAR